MQEIKNQTAILVIKDAQIYSPEEIITKLENLRVYLERLADKKEVPETYVKLALAELQQVYFLLNGTKDLGQKGGKDDIQ